MTAFGADGMVGRLRASRLLMAALADQQADLAEEFAVCLEHAAKRNGAERRLALAGAEREIAKIERRNAARLRDADSLCELHLEHLPTLPGFRPRDAN